MPKLKITVKTGNIHQHVVYLRDDGTGVASFDANHTPQIVFDPGIDLQTGQKISEPSWIVQDPNGYQHSLTDMPFDESVEEKKDKVSLVSDVLADYQECFDYENTSRTNGKEADRMYGDVDQWRNDEKPPDANRTSVTINIIEDKIDNLSGYQRQNRTDIMYLPSESGDAFGADVLNIVSKKILNNCHYQREKTKVFDDEAIVGRGLFNLYENYEKNVQGDIGVERFKWDEAFFGPHEKDDVSDCEVMFKTKWYSEGKIRALYPDKLGKTGGDQKILEYQPTLKITEDRGLETGKYELIDINAKKFRLLERWKKEYSQTVVFVFAEDGFAISTEGWKKTYIDMSKTIQGASTISREQYRMRKTTTVSDVLLDDVYVKDKDFEIIPVYAKFRNGKFWGKVRNICDLQMFINKTYSQFQDIMGKVANYGYYYDGETFDNVQDEEAWRTTVSSPGGTHKVANAEKRPVKEEGVKFPSEIVQAIQMFNQTVREMMNVNLDFAGMSKASESGIAIKQKIVQQLIGNDFLFDNLSFAEKIMARLLVKKIQKLYTPERLLRILESQNVMEQKKNKEGKGISLNGQSIEQYPREELLKLLETTDFTECDIDVGEAPDAPSAMMSAFLLCLEAARNGTPIPPDVFVSLAPIPEMLKTKIMESLAAAQQAEAAKDEMKYGTEIKKAQIAQAGKAMDKNPAQQEGVMGPQEAMGGV